jgi:predicted GIY-YIG superfamily endonuclease
MGAFLYILRCADDSYYVGTTRGTLEGRLGEHNAGHFGGYTAKRRPVSLVFHEEFDRITDAISAERQVKGWRREKKEALIRGDYDLLRLLAKHSPSRRRFVPPRDDPSRRRFVPPQDEGGT